MPFDATDLRQAVITSLKTSHQCFAMDHLPSPSNEFLIVTNHVNEKGPLQPSYRLIGDFWLDSPEKYLSATALCRLRELEPFLRLLEDGIHRSAYIMHLDGIECIANTSIPKAQRAPTPPNLICVLSSSISRRKSPLWNPPRRREEVVIPSGSLDWPLAHHLHNPSNQLQTVSNLNSPLNVETNLS